MAIKALPQSGCILGRRLIGIGCTAIYKFLNSYRGVIISSIIFAIITFILPIRRPIFIWQDAENSAFTWIVNKGQYYLMLLTIYAGAFIYLSKRFERLMDKITSPKVAIPLSYIAMVSMSILFIAKAPGLGWTWSTVGIHLMTILLMTLLLGGKIGSGKAFCLGCGFVFMIVGLWEIPYQYGLWKYYDYPQGYGIWSFYNQVKFMSPFIFFGMYIVAVILYAERKHLVYKKAAIIPLAYTVVAYLLWFASGFWCDIYFDWTNRVWLASEFNYWSMVLYRTTKVSAALIPLIMLAPQWRIKDRSAK